MNNNKQLHPPVILLHGLHMHAWAMQPLANRLREQGFTVNIFGYYSMLQPISAHSDRLNRYLCQHFQTTQPLYLVGHSLGGLVIRDFLQRYSNWQIERVVTLGTPHNGSLSAQRVMQFLPIFVGKSYHAGLDGRTPKLPTGVALGSIAGTQSAGLGRVVLRQKDTQMFGENDGTVFVTETKLSNQTDHLTLPVSHTGMIFDRHVTEQVAYFLKNGQFLHNLSS